VRRILADSDALDATVFTGLVPQEEGPAYLAACDVLSSPHVPNPDGTPFFGSPTKLFEYMAMGRGIVASDLDQIGEVLDHGRTAWLVPPGEVDALADGLRRLIDDPELRGALGSAARREAVTRHTWREHTRRTIERLREVVAGAGRPPHARSGSWRCRGRCRRCTVRAALRCLARSASSPRSAGGRSPCVWRHGRVVRGGPMACLRNRRQASSWFAYPRPKNG
jgi:Glycosyl transferases group 1